MSVHCIINLIFTL